MSASHCVIRVLSLMLVVRCFRKISQQVLTSNRSVTIMGVTERLLVKGGIVWLEIQKKEF